jgi:hypothetical protein
MMPRYISIAETAGYLKVSDRTAAVEHLAEGITVEYANLSLSSQARAVMRDGPGATPTVNDHGRHRHQPVGVRRNRRNWRPPARSWAI